MKTKMIIKNGTIFSGEIKKVKSFPAAIRINGEDTASILLCFVINDDIGCRFMTVSPDERGIIDSITISGKDEEEATRLIEINRLSYEEYNLIIRLIEEAKDEIQ